MLWVDGVLGESCVQDVELVDRVDSSSPALNPLALSSVIIQIFIVALSFVFFSKALAGTYMKSTITQIERRFDLSSSLTGLIDGGFEMGNIL